MTNLHKHFLIQLGRKIRQGREGLGLSQEEFGKKVKMHRTYIGMIERGEKNITISNLKRVAVAIGCEVRDLIDF
jgi:transcriptional regulator with XRE-family HTH domain